MTNTGPARTTFGQAAAGIFAGYLAACVTASLLIVTLALVFPSVWHPVSLLPLKGMVAFSLVIVGVGGLPGFALLRFGIDRLRRSEWQAFAAGGALNAGAAFILLIIDEPAAARIVNQLLFMQCILIGGLAGAACWGAEQVVSARFGSRNMKAVSQ